MTNSDQLPGNEQRRYCCARCWAFSLRKVLPPDLRRELDHRAGRACAGSPWSWPHVRVMPAQPRDERWRDLLDALECEFEDEMLRDGFFAQRDSTRCGPQSETWC